MDYLLNYDFSDTVIENLNSFYDLATIELLNYNADNVKKVIELFREKGIKNIEDILFMRVDIFFQNPKKLEEKFDQDLELIEKINTSIENIYEL